MGNTNIDVNCNNQQTCFLTSRSFSSNINQPCNGTIRTYFEDFSCINGEYQVEIFSGTPLPCLMTAIIEFQDGEIIERPIAFNSEFSFFSGNVRRISIRCDGNPAGTCSGSVFGNKLFCFCCSEDNNGSCCNGECNDECNDECDEKLRSCSESHCNDTRSRYSRSFNKRKGSKRTKCRVIY